MSEPVLFERDGAIVTLTLNKPETRNPTTDPDLLDGLNVACARIASFFDKRPPKFTGA